MVGSTLLWTIMGVGATIVAMFVAIILHALGKHRKRLSYRLLSKTPILGIEAKDLGRLQILYDGQPVQDAQLVVLRFANTGNVPIVPEDFNEPVRLVARGSAKVLAAEVVSTNPADLRVILDANPSRVMVSPTLFNPRDSFDLRLVASQLGEIAIEGRIIGVSEISSFVEGKGRFAAGALLGLLLTILGILGLVYKGPALEFLPSFWPGLAFGLAYVSFTVGSMTWAEFKKIAAAVLKVARD